MVFSHNKKIISINNILIQKLYENIESREINADDDACGYSNLLDTVQKVYKSRPILAQRILFLIDDSLNDTSSFVQDKDTANRIIIEAIKTNNLDLLNKKLFCPILLPTYAIKSVFGTLDEYGSVVLNKFYHKEACGVGAVFFENAIRWISEYINNYLMNLNILDEKYNLSLWRMLFITSDIYNSADLFYKCDSDDKLFGFHLLYNIWHISRKPNQPTFDILFRFVIIELYLKGKNFIEPGNMNYLLTRGPKFRLERYLIKRAVPKITIEPSYVATLANVGRLNQRICKLGNKIYKETHA